MVKSEPLINIERSGKDIPIDNADHLLLPSLVPHYLLQSPETRRQRICRPRQVPLFAACRWLQRRLLI